MLLVVQSARSALDCLVKPSSSHTTPLIAYKLSVSAIGSKRALHHFSVN